MPKLHWEASIDKIPDLPYKLTVLKYLGSIKERMVEGQGLLLHGPYSSGKSAIAAICLKTALLLQFPKIGLWIKAKALPDYIINKTRFDDAFTMYSRAKSVPLLVIDEIQLRKNLGYTENMAEDLIRERIDKQLATIITTNHSLSTIRDEYPALYEILQEGVLPLKIEGCNFRQEKRINSEEW